MTERERWIVYPLLFLALGASLRDKFGGPEAVDATRVRCDEIIATKMMIADPHDKLPRIVLKSVPAGSQNAHAAPNTSGQIELLDSSQRVQTAITHGAVITHGLKAQAIAVADPAGRNRVQIGTKPEGVEKTKQQTSATSGWVEIFGKDNSAMPIVRLAASPDGGFIFARHDGFPLGVVVGNFPQGSGVFLQVGDKQIPLSGPASAEDLKKLEKLLPKDAVTSDKPATNSAEQKPTTEKQGENASAEPNADDPRPAKP